MILESNSYWRQNMLMTFSGEPINGVVDDILGDILDISGSSWRENMSAIIPEMRTVQYIGSIPFLYVTKMCFMEKRTKCSFG